jgi:hypothetical protein
MSKQSVSKSPIKSYQDYLTRCADSCRRGYEMTGYEFHKGGEKAYRDALAKLTQYPIEADEPSQESNSSPRL